MHTRWMKWSLALGIGVLLGLPAAAWAQDAGAQPGECASGFCGTPKNNGGGGCGCGGGGSILVNNTDIGQTYSTSDDYDGDGIEDDFDNCTFVANRDQADGDGDKIGDACDNCPAAANESQRDTNANGQGDACDADIDGDRIANAQDNCAAVPNVAQKDADKDGLGDVCDADMDNDAVMNAVDNCPLVFNPDQLKSEPGRFGDACDADTDKDQIEDAKDDCPAVYNADQLDADKDGLGDLCDADADNDVVANTVDNCPLVKNADQADADKDGVGDACQTHGFCFVAFHNREAKCLDPKSVFAVTAGANAAKYTVLDSGKRIYQTGEPIYVALYANREKTSIRYSWVLTAVPEGAADTVKNPRGTVVDSSAFEYKFVLDGERPSFTPTRPGTYTLKLAADLVKPDPLFPAVAHAESEVRLVVEGAPTASSGCNVGGASRGGAAGLALAALALLVRRRRR